MAVAMVAVLIVAITLVVKHSGSSRGGDNVLDVFSSGVNNCSMIHCKLS